MIASFIDLNNVVYQNPNKRKNSYLEMNNLRMTIWKKKTLPLLFS